VVAYTLVERIVDWVEPAFASAGYLIIAGGVLMERSVFIGLIVPGDLILALGGVYASQHKMDLTAVIIIGTLAAISGESIGYWLGRRYGAGLIRRIPVVRRLGGHLENSQEYFRRHGGKTVAFGRYATAAGAFIPFSAGVGRMPYRRFLQFDVPAIVVWAAAISIFGFSFGQHLDFVDKVLSRFGYGVLALFILIFGGRFAWRWSVARREQRRERRRSRSEASR
jgi:membrane protein DedA with SNARE-associated domain